MWHQGCFFVPNRFGWMIKGPRWVVLKHVYEVMIAYYPWNPLSISSSRSFIYIFSLHDYEAVAVNHAKMASVNFDGRKHEKTTIYLMKVYEAALSRFFLGFSRRSHTFCPVQTHLTCFILQMSNLRVPWTLKNEPRSPLDVWMGTLSGDRHSQSHCRSESLYLRSAGGRSCDIGTDW